MTIGVYALVFPNDDLYVGSSISSCEGRHRSHLRGLRRGSHRNKHMQKLFNKYGEPEFHILQGCGNPKGMKIKEIIIRLRENRWIKDQGGNAINYGPAYPCAMFGKHPSEETRRKLSEAKKRENLSDEARRHMSEARKGNTNTLGRHLSKEHRHNISEAKKGKPKSEETRRKMSEARKGRHLSEEHRRKLSESLKGKPATKGFTGRKHSEGTKRKMSESKKGNQQPW